MGQNLVCSPFLLLPNVGLGWKYVQGKNTGKSTFFCICSNCSRHYQPNLSYLPYLACDKSTQCIRSKNTMSYMVYFGQAKKRGRHQVFCILITFPSLLRHSVDDQKHVTTLALVLWHDGAKKDIMFVSGKAFFTPKMNLLNKSNFRSTTRCNLIRTSGISKFWYI
jgi:hypothetical protein